MDLREIRRETESLTNISETTHNLKKNWVSPLRKNSNKHLPFIKNLDEDTKKELKHRLDTVHKHINEIGQDQLINNKLKTYSRYLIELKLTTFNGDQSKSKVITHSLLNDDFMNLKQTLTDIQQFDKKVAGLSEQYHEINDLLHKKLSLEETLFFMNLPHLKYLNNLLQTSKKHKTISRHIGKHMVALIKETQLKKRR
jgi:hypothetical protein